MLRASTSSLLVSTLVALSACGVRGSGESATETRSLDPFTEIEFSGAFDLVVHVGDYEQKVEVSGDDNIVARIETRVSGDALIVEHDGWLRPELPLVVEVWVGSLASIDASGATNLDVEGLHGERFELDISGAADADLLGKVGRFDASISGAADVDARSLEAESVIINMSGAGEAEVWATRELEATISGAGHVEYWGEPSEVRESVSGAGTVHKH
ncbi:head GIN domain-containing protein [Nannocystaceae bacterium ST9]